MENQPKYSNDLLDNPGLLPGNVQAVLEEFENAEQDYTSCEALKSSLESIGYTVNFDLGGEPFDLRRINGMKEDLL